MSRQLACLFLLLCSCTGYAASAVSGPARTLRVRVLADPQTLDWNRASTWMAGMFIFNIMEGLIEIGRDLKPVPVLAKSWTASRDNKTFTFRLREGVLWSDGVPLRASQFVDSWRRLLSPNLSNTYANALFDIDGAESYKKGELADFSKVGVKALSDDTLEVRLRAPVPHWHWQTAIYSTFPIRQDLIDKQGDAWAKAGTLVTLGPFVPSTYEPNHLVTLTRNPRYHGKRGNLDQLSFALVTDDASALNLYEKGQLDFLIKPPTTLRAKMLTRPDFHSWPELRVVYLAFNTDNGPSADRHFRRALAAAIDRGKIKGLFFNEYTPAGSFVPPGLAGHFPSLGIPFDLALAQSELRASGIKPAELPPLVLHSHAFDDDIALGGLIKSELETNLGIKVQLKPAEPAIYYSRMNSHADVALELGFWSVDYPHPDDLLSVFLGNAMSKRFNWASDKYDALVRGTRTQSSAAERNKSYENAQKILEVEEAAIMPLYYSRTAVLYRSNVKGFKPGPLNWFIFRDVSK